MKFWYIWLIATSVAAFVAFFRSNKLKSRIDGLSLEILRLRTKLDKLEPRPDAKSKESPADATIVSPPMPASIPTATADWSSTRPGPVPAAAQPEFRVVAESSMARPVEVAASLPATAENVSVPLPEPMATPPEPDAIQMAAVEEVTTPAPAKPQLWQPAAEATAGPEPAAPSPTRTEQPAEMSVPGATESPSNFEERIGARAFVWIGGIAIALAGGFLVKYSYDSGLLGPGVRVVLGILLGVAFLGGGEFMRSKSIRIAQASSAGGVASIYASLFAAIAVHYLLDPTFGFVLLAFVTMGAIALALRQGPFVGLIGLAGGFLTPAIVSKGQLGVAVLFGFLFLLQLGSQVLARRRGWWWLAAISIGGSMVWVALWLVALPRLGDPVVMASLEAFPSIRERVWVLLFLLATPLLAIWSSRRDDGQQPVPQLKLNYTALAALAVSLGFSAILVYLHDYSNFEWVLFGLLSIVALLLARRRPIAEPLAAFAAVLGLLLLGIWPEQMTMLGSRNFTFMLTSVCITLGAVFTLGGFVGMLGAQRKRRWAVFSAYASAGYFLVAYWRLLYIADMPHWGLITLALAALHAVLSWLLLRRRVNDDAYSDPLGVHALAVSGFLALTFGLELENGWITVAWALQLPAMAWIERRLNIDWLRNAAWVGVGLVMLRLLPDPLFFRLPVGDTPLFNGILLGYGLPLCAFVAALVMFRRRRDDNLVRLLEVAAAIVAFKLVSLEIRHLFHGQDTLMPSPGLGEYGTLIVAWLTGAVGLLIAGTRLNRVALVWCGGALTAIGTIAFMVGPMLIKNPLFTPTPVGEWPIFDLVLLSYGGPAILLAIAARLLSENSWPWIARAVGAAALLGGMTGLSLEIRRLFHGPTLYGGGMSIGELGTLVIAWLLIGAGLLVASDRLRRQSLAWCAKAIIGCAAAGIVLGLLIARNPLFTPELVGDTPIFDLVMFAYGVPTLLLALITRLFAKRSEQPLAYSTGALATAMGMITVWMEIRRCFHGPDIYGFNASLAEVGTLVTAWLVIGAGLLMASTKLRQGALAWSAKAVLGGAVVVMLLSLLVAHNPLLTPESVGGIPLIDLVLFAYGVPALLLALVANMFAGREERQLANLAGGLALAMGMIAISLEIRRWFHGPIIYGADLGLAELGLIVSAWLAAGTALLHFSRRAESPIRIWGARSILALAVGGIGFGLLLARNPFLHEVPVGTLPIINSLLIAFIAPALLLLVAAREFLLRGERPIALAAGTLSALLGWVWLSLEVRHWFQGPILSGSQFGSAETYAYSAAWLAYGVGLLAAGIASGRRLLRYASLAVVVFAIGKVFLIDTGELTGLFRVASFLGLGLCLLALGYVYQRYVFRRVETAPAN